MWRIIGLLAGLLQLDPPPHVAPPVQIAAAVAPVPSGASLPNANMAAAEAPAKDPENLATVLKKLQRRYEDTTSFEATFVQKYTFTMLKKTEESSGRIQFHKPGRLRWDYEAPKPKSFVVDGQKLWVLQPRDNTVMVDHCFKQDGLTASVSFLWGAGDIEKSFDASNFPGQFGKPTDHHILLMPRTPSSIFAKLILVVDPVSYRVVQSIVVDHQGNVNRFLFGEPTFNVAPAADAFVVVPPKGAHVSRVPGSCDPDARGP